MMSIGKYLYFLTLVADHSGLTVLTRCKRNETLSNDTDDWSNKPGTTTGKRINYVRCDNAKEFLSSAFNEYLGY